MKKISFLVVTGLATTLAFSAVAPGFASASEMKRSSKPATVTTDYIESIGTGVSLTDDSFGFYDYEKQGSLALDALMIEENTTKVEWDTAGAQMKKQMLIEAPGDYEVTWRLAAARKAVKFLVNHYNIIPSKKLRGYIKEKGPKMIYWIDKMEAYTHYGIAVALTKAGIPEKYAYAIADFIVKYLL